MKTRDRIIAIAIALWITAVTVDYYLYIAHSDCIAFLRPLLRRVLPW